MRETHQDGHSLPSAAWILMVETQIAVLQFLLYPLIHPETSTHKQMCRSSLLGMSPIYIN